MTTWMRRIRSRFLIKASNFWNTRIGTRCSCSTAPEIFLSPRSIRRSLSKSPANTSWIVLPMAKPRSPTEWPAFALWNSSKPRKNLCIAKEIRKERKYGTKSLRRFPSAHNSRRKTGRRRENLQLRKPLRMHHRRPHKDRLVRRDPKRRDHWFGLQDLQPQFRV